MGSLSLCCVSPHPPILVPEVGKGEVSKVAASAGALARLASEIAGIGPETLVVMSPHSPVYSDAFIVKADREMTGSFRQFGAPQVRIQAPGDEELASAIRDFIKARGMPVASGGTADRGLMGAAPEIDHGMLVPLYFLAPPSYMLVGVSISFLDYWSHYQVGLAIREASEATGRKTVFIASGDLSHRLLPGAPAGYDVRGEEFDRAIVGIVASCRFAELFELDPALIEAAGECGLRSVFALAGALDGYSVQTEVLSYEGPFGVGYMVARALPVAEDPARKLTRP